MLGDDLNDGILDLATLTRPRVYGVWLINAGSWVKRLGGDIWWTEHPQVGEAQVKFGQWEDGPVLLREIHDGGYPVSTENLENFVPDPEWGEISPRDAVKIMMRQHWKLIEEFMDKARGEE